MKTRRELVFDLDGTLTDPAEGIGRSINHALSVCGYSRLEADAVSTYIGPPLDRTFRQITGTNSTALIEKLVAAFRERYGEIGFSENVIYPGIPEALDALAEAGFVLGVCTSKRVDFAERILELFDIRKHLIFVNGGDVGVDKKHQLESLREARVIGASAVMIGDRAVDVHAAKANGLLSVGVLWGHGSHTELESAGVDHILHQVPQLLELGMKIERET